MDGWMDLLLDGLNALLTYTLHIELLFDMTNNLFDMANNN